jgi:iron complex outermembrane receptor protein
MKMISTSFMALLLIASGAIINSAAAQSDSVLEIEEILVTASKRGATNLQDMPMAITALTEQKMEMIGADDMMDYLGLAPGISYRLTSATGSRDDIRGGRRLNIRGIESGPDGIPTTAFYLDDTPVPVMDPKLFDIARVEILRGPQGTLYGANSMGGTVRMVTNKPEINRFAYKVDNTVGFTPEGGEILHLNGMLNVPILEDKLALRGVLFSRSEGGFIDIVEDPDMYTDAVGHTRSNLDQNDEKAHGGRIALKWTPTDNLTITPSVFYQSIEIDGTPEYEPQIGDLLHRDCHGCGEITPPRQPTEEHRVAERQTNDFYLYSMEIAYDFGNNMSLTSSTSTFNSKMWSVDDFSKGMVRWGLPSDPQAIGLQDIRTDRFTQEIRLSSTGDKLSWIAGFFYMDEHRDFFQDLPNTGHLWCTVDLCGADLSLSDSLFTGVETHDDKSTAVFGEVTYAPSEEWEITAGLRYFSDDQNQLIIFDGFFNGGYAKVEGVAAGESFSPKLQTAYHPSEDTMFYALVAKGFRPGGPTNLIPTTCDADLLLLGLSEPKSEYDSDTLWNYEAGVKTSLMNNRVTLNATAFYMDWTDVQNGVRLACGFGFVGNVGAAESTGVELEFSAYLTDNFNFSGSMGYTDATYTETSEETGVMAGDRIVNTPRMTASLVGQYLFPVVDGYQGYLAGSYQYTDDIFDPSNSLGTPKRDAFSTVDVRLGVQHENWEVVVFVDNLTDVRGMLFHSINQAAGVSPFIANTVGVIRPRTYGVTLRWSGGD